MDPFQISSMEIRGAIQISDSSERVNDADEEVFILYSDLQASPTSDTDTFRGLGPVDSRRDTITITFHLKPAMESQKLDPDSPVASRSLSARKSKKIAKNKGKDKSEREKGTSIDVELAQDKTALRSRKGDTGSVLWRASMDLAQLLLQQLYCGSAAGSLLNKSVVSTQHVIELGAGTGLLAIAFAPFVRHYTVTDVEPLIPLLRKNISTNFEDWPHCAAPSPGSNISVEALDWLALQATNPALRPHLVPTEPADLILVVDCIYHPSLLPALVETIDYLTISNRTAVLVVMELRAVDVTREFLHLWLSRSPKWEIWRMDGLLGRPYAVWAGWRRNDQGT